MFALYSLRGKSYRFVSEVKIAGSLGNHIASEAGSKNPDGAMPWSLSGRELCRAVIEKHNIAEPLGSCKVVIDATFSRADALLLEIDHLWGLSYPRWTPILLRMRTLTERKRNGGKSTPVMQFRAAPRKPEWVHEFLYLQCGYKEGGKRNWGKMGYTNAVLLWPDALAHLLRQIGYGR